MECRALSTTPESDEGGREGCPDQHGTLVRSHTPRQIISLLMRRRPKCLLNMAIVKRKAAGELDRYQKKVKGTTMGRVSSQIAAGVLGFIAGDISGAYYSQLVTGMAYDMAYNTVSSDRSVYGLGKGPPYFKPDKFPFNLPKNKYTLV